MTLFFFISKFLNTHYTVREFWKKKGSETFFSPRYIEEAQISLVSCVISHHRKPTLILGKETAENKNETNSFQTFYAPFSSDSRQQTMVTRETWWCPEGQCIGIQVEKSSFRQDTFLSLLRGRNGWQQTVRKLYEMLRGIIVKEQTRENRQTKHDEKFYIEYRRYEFFFFSAGIFVQRRKKMNHMATAKNWLTFLWRMPTEFHFLHNYTKWRNAAHRWQVRAGTCSSENAK